MDQRRWYNVILENNDLQVLDLPNVLFFWLQPILYYHIYPQPLDLIFISILRVQNKQDESFEKQKKNHNIILYRYYLENQKDLDEDNAS